MQNQTIEKASPTAIKITTTETRSQVVEITALKNRSQELANRIADSIALKAVVDNQIAQAEGLGLSI